MKKILLFISLTITSIGYSQTISWDTICPNPEPDTCIIAQRKINLHLPPVGKIYWRDPDNKSFIIIRRKIKWN